jgi:hypothetical protein
MDDGWVEDEGDDGSEDCEYKSSGDEHGDENVTKWRWGWWRCSTVTVMTVMDKMNEGADGNYDGGCD